MGEDRRQERPQFGLRPLAVGSGAAMELFDVGPAPGRGDTAEDGLDRPAQITRRTLLRLSVRAGAAFIGVALAARACGPGLPKAQPPTSVPPPPSPPTDTPTPRPTNTPRPTATPRPTLTPTPETVRPQDTCVEIRGHQTRVRAAAFAPDGRLATSDERSVKLWDASGALIQGLDAPSGTTLALDFSADGRLLAAATDEGHVRTWEASGGKIVGDTKLDVTLDQPLALGFEGDSRLWVALSAGGHDVQLWDATAPATPRRLVGVHGIIYSLAFGASCLAEGGATQDAAGRRALAAGTGDGSIVLWDVATASVQKTLAWKGESPLALALRADGRMLAAASNFALGLWDLTSGDLLGTIRMAHSTTAAIALSPDGATLARVDSREVTVWDVVSELPLKALQPDAGTGRRAAPTVAAFSADGKRLVVGDTGGGLVVWDAGNWRSERAACLFDKETLETGGKANSYQMADEYGILRTFTLPCGSPLPEGAVCTCNCVEAAAAAPDSSGTICTCVPVCICMAV